MLGDFRRVDPQEAHGVGVTVPERDDDGVAVDRLHDAHLWVRRAPLVTDPPPRDRGGGQHGDHDHGPGEGHAPRLPTGYDAVGGARRVDMVTPHA